MLPCFDPFPSVLRHPSHGHRRTSASTSIRNCVKSQSKAKQHIPLPQSNTTRSQSNNITWTRASTRTRTTIRTRVQTNIRSRTRANTRTRASTRASIRTRARVVLVALPSAGSNTRARPHLHLLLAASRGRERQTRPRRRHLLRPVKSPVKYPVKYPVKSPVKYPVKSTRTPVEPSDLSRELRGGAASDGHLSPGD